MPVEVEGAIAALDPALGTALATEGGEAARRKAVLQVPSGGTPHDDVLVALATQAAAHGRLELADLCAARCASSAKLACRVRSSYIKAMVMVGQLDASKEFPAQGDVYTRRMVSTRIEALHLLEGRLRQLERAQAERVEHCVVLLARTGQCLCVTDCERHRGQTGRPALRARRRLILSRTGL